MSSQVIITGANGNLGAAAVKKFLDLDYHVIAVDHSGSHLGFTDGRSNFELHEADLGEEATSALFFDEIISLRGKIDAALLLVGGFAMGNIETTDAAALKKMYSLNFETVYHAARPLFLHMLKHNYGRMVFVGAKPALEAGAGKDLIAYALSKTLLFKLAELLNAEAADKNVTVSVIVPGVLDTKTNREQMPGADTSGWTKTEDVAELLAFICSREGSVVKQPVYKLYS